MSKQRNLVEDAELLLALPRGSSSIVDLAPILEALLEIVEALKLFANREDSPEWYRLHARALLEKLGVK